MGEGHCASLNFTFWRRYSTAFGSVSYCANLAFNGSARSRNICGEGYRMKKVAVAAVIAICVPSPTLADERVGDAALGAVSGAVVLGPIGAVAGAAIGYTAGPAIANAWGLRRSEPRPARQSALPPKTTSSKRVYSTQVIPPADPRQKPSARAAYSDPDSINPLW